MGNSKLNETYIFKISIKMQFFWCNWSQDLSWLGFGWFSSFYFFLFNFIVVPPIYTGHKGFCGGLMYELFFYIDIYIFFYFLIFLVSFFLHWGRMSNNPGSNICIFARFQCLIAIFCFALVFTDLSWLCFGCLFLFLFFLFSGIVAPPTHIGLRAFLGGLMHALFFLKKLYFLVVLLSFFLHWGGGGWWVIILGKIFVFLLVFNDSEFSSLFLLAFIFTDLSQDLSWLGFGWFFFFFII